MKTKTLSVALIALLCGGCRSYNKGECILVAPFAMDSYVAETGTFLQFTDGAYWYEVGGKIKSATAATHNVAPCDT